LPKASKVEFEPFQWFGRKYYAFNIEKIPAEENETSKFRISFFVILCMVFAISLIQTGLCQEPRALEAKREN
jgi:hypothetical protein